MRLILIRHGRTEENIKRIAQGHLPGRLSNEGMAQARMAADGLADEPMAAIFSSDLARARETAAIIARAHNLQTVLDPRLREQSFGIYEGRPVSELIDRMARENSDYTCFRAEGGECRDDLDARVTGFLTDLREIYTDETVAVVTHNGVLKLLLARMIGCEFQGNGHDAIGNGDAVVVNISPDGSASLERICPCDPARGAVLPEPVPAGV